MDSVTQALLGAAAAESVVGKQVGRKASAWGGFLGILPDLDILVRYSNPVDSFTYHRSFSHSLPVLLVLTPLLVWLILRLHPASREHRARWFWVVGLCLVTHVLLDSLTIYGTQLLWPFSDYPFGLGSIFIIDPLYSLPLLAGCIAVFVTRGRAARRLLKAGLVFSSLYLVWGLLAQQLMLDRLQRHLDEQGMTHDHLLVTPAPFNSVLWRFVVRVDNGYYEGFMSFLDPPGIPAMRFQASRDDLVDSLRAWPSAARLMTFSKGQFGIFNHGDDIIMSDLRMGVSPDFVFSFKVGETDDDGIVETTPSRFSGRMVTGRKLAWIFYRIGDASLPLPVGNFGDR